MIENERNVNVRVSCIHWQAFRELVLKKGLKLNYVVSQLIGKYVEENKECQEI